MLELDEWLSVTAEALVAMFIASFILETVLERLNGRCWWNLALRWDLLLLSGVKILNGDLEEVSIDALYEEESAQNFDLPFQACILGE